MSRETPGFYASRQLDDYPIKFYKKDEDNPNRLSLSIQVLQDKVKELEERVKLLEDIQCID